MRNFATIFLAAASCLVSQVAAAPSVPVHPGSAKNIIITKDNTLNATVGGRPPPTPHHPSANAQLPLAMVNNLGAGVNAYVTGLDPAGRIVFVQSDGGFYYPYADSSYTTPREINANIAIPLGPQGSTTNVKMPDYISSARVWFSQGQLHFYTVWNSGLNAPGLVQPSFTNPQDPSAGVSWGFVELTNNNSGLFANISYVDFVGLPLGMSLRSSDGSVQTVQGLRKGSVNSICSSLQNQQNRDGNPWGDLCQSGNGGYLRAVAQYPYTRVNTQAFATYYQQYVDKVWQYYTGNTLTIDTQNGYGRVNCRVSGNTLNCDGDNRGYNKPSTSDIWGCNDGPFAIQGGDNDVHRAVVPRLCSAFHRSTLLAAGGNVQPGPAATTYYKNDPTNYYSLFVHQNEADGRGYAFSYDDVNPSGGVEQSGVVSHPNPQLLTVNVGGV